MKAKTKDQLKAEISKLELERDILNRNFELSQKTGIDILWAITTAVRTILWNEKNNKELKEQYGLNYQAFAWFVGEFFAELQRLTGVDGVSLAEVFLDDMGFDECTAAIIKQRIPIYFQISKMYFEGKSEKEIYAYSQKCKRAEGRE